MGEAQRFVVVGAGLAGARAAVAPRGAGFEKRLALPREEPVRPYGRVLLSGQYLRWRMRDLLRQRQRATAGRPLHSGNPGPDRASDPQTLTIATEESCRSRSTSS